jgi:hypothetical protein
MATSGSTNYNQTERDLIQMAFFHIGKYGNGRDIAPEDYSIARTILNTMLKSWSADLHLWAKQEGILYLTQYTSKYTLNSTSLDAYFTTVEDNVTKQLSSAAAAAATSLSMSTSNIAVNDTIGIVLDTGALFWTVVTNITSSVALTINSALPSAAASGNLVFSFTNRAVRPMRVLDARVISGFDAGATTTQIERPLAMMAYQDYWQMASTTNNGSMPNQCLYEPKLASGSFFVWPRPTDCSVRVQLTYERTLEDMDDIDDNFDLPSEWLEPLQWQLALRLCPGFGRMERYALIAQTASLMLDRIKEWDNELNSITFNPSRGGYE